VTGQLARDIDAAYAAGQAAVRATDQAERTRLLGTLYTSLLPAVDARLFSLERLHAGDPPAEHADVVRLIRQWAAVRDLFIPAALTPGQAAAVAGRLAAAYQPVSAHLDRLLGRELDDAQADHAHASADATRATGLIAGAADLGVVLGEGARVSLPEMLGSYAVERRRPVGGRPGLEEWVGGSIRISHREVMPQAGAA
jgi:hypothetical protein